MGSSDLVNENKPVEVVYLMLDCSRFKGIGFHQDFFASCWEKSFQSQSGGAFNIAREVRNRHAAFPTLLIARGFKDFRINHHELTMMNASLGVLADIEAKHSPPDADLISCKTNAPW